MFPFGFGLSYSQFELADVSLIGNELEITVHNTGNYDGETVLQIYGRVRHASIIRPLRTLIGWQRIAVKSGEKIVLRIPINISRLRIVDSNNTPVKLSGAVDFYVGFDSTADKHLTYMIEE